MYTIVYMRECKFIQYFIYKVYSHLGCLLPNAVPPIYFAMSFRWRLSYARLPHRVVCAPLSLVPPPVHASTDWSSTCFVREHECVIRLLLPAVVGAIHLGVFPECVWGMRPRWSGARFHGRPRGRSGWLAVRT